MQMQLARPIYETARSLDEERRIADKLEVYRNCQLLKLPRGYNFDFVAMRNGSVVAWVEVKDRKICFDTYPTVFFPLLKLLRAIELNSLTRCRCFFAVQFKDCLGYADVLESKGKLGWRGRRDRDDSEDEEPVLLIPTEEFQLLEVAR